MHKSLLILSFIVICGYSVEAQNRCGTSQWLQILETESPQVKDRRELINAQTNEWIYNNNTVSRSVITIPVVVHILYNTPVQNISDEQILSQIEVLNQDFRRLNADRVNTPAIFQSVAADCEIEFCLAKQDPQGNPTNGITRTNTYAQVFQMGNFMKRTETGGKASWDTKKYLNIWVCNLADNLLGYASVPGTEIGLYDGVVISHEAFGKGGSTKSPYNLGRTATHEIGHWLNLQHIWGDNDGSDPCSGTDEVADTPNQARQNEGCPDFPHSTCGNISDMFMNYMDYTQDNCMNLFTIGQKNRMHATLNGFRSGILSSKGCQDPLLLPQCDTITNAISPDGLVFYTLNEFDQTQQGFLIGHNSRKDMAFADYIASEGEKTIKRLLFDFSRADFGSALDSVMVFIRTNESNGPGSLLGSSKIAIADIHQNIAQFKFSEAVFEPEVHVSGDFFAGFEIEYVPGDSVGIYSTQFDEESVANAWFLDSSGIWNSYIDQYDIAISIGVYVEVCSTVSIPEIIENPNTVFVFPNPAHECINIRCNSDRFNWEFLSTDGQILEKGSSSGSPEYSIPVNHLHNGLYLLRINSGKFHTTAKFIISH